MLGSFLGKLDRYFLVGYIFPCLLFIALAIGLEYVGLVPFQPLSSLLQQFAVSWKTVTVLIAVLLMSLMLEALNRPIIRLYEGYPFVHWRFLVVWQKQAWH